MSDEDCGWPLCRKIHWQGSLTDTVNTRDNLQEARAAACRVRECLFTLIIPGQRIVWARVPLQVAG